MLFCIFKFNIKTNKMNNIKDIIIGIFAVIGFVAIVTGFTNETSDPQYPESHVWEMEISDADSGRAYMYNKVTGEVRKYAAGNFYTGDMYHIMQLYVPKEKKKK